MRVVLLATPRVEDFQAQAVRSILASGRHTVCGCLVDARPVAPLRRRLLEHLRRGRGGYVLLLGLGWLRRRLRHAPDASAWFAGLGVPVEHARDPYSDATLGWLRSQSPDVLVRLGGFGIVLEPLLDLAPQGVLSYHFGDLRRYRGQPPCFWELAQGEKLTGITVQRLCEQLDAGEPIVELPLPIARDSTVRSLTRLQLTLCPPLMLTALDRLERPDRAAVPLDAVGRLYTFPPLRTWLLVSARTEWRALRARLFRAAVRISRPLRSRVDASLVYSFDLRRPVPDFRADVPVEMCRATPAEVDEAALLVGGDRPAVFAARLAEGMECFVAKVEGRVVAYNWTRFCSGEDEGDLLELGPGEIYTTDAFTVAGFRGAKIHTETLAYMLRVAQEQGVVLAYTMASVFKRGSRKTHGRLGWRVSGRVLRVRLRGRHHVLTLWGSAAPLRSHQGPRAARLALTPRMEDGDG